MRISLAHMRVLSVSSPFERQIAQRVDAAMPTRSEQRGGVVLLDNSGTVERVAHLQCGTIIDCGRDRQLLLWQ